MHEIDRQVPTAEKLTPPADFAAHYSERHGHKLDVEAQMRAISDTESKTGILGVNKDVINITDKVPAKSPQLAANKQRLFIDGNCAGVENSTEDSSAGADEVEDSTQHKLVLVTSNFVPKPPKDADASKPAIPPERITFPAIDIGRKVMKILKDKTVSPLRPMLVTDKPDPETSKGSVKIGRLWSPRRSPMKQFRDEQKKR